MKCPNFGPVYTPVYTLLFSSKFVLGPAMHKSNSILCHRALDSCLMGNIGSLCCAAAVVHYIIITQSNILKLL